MAKTGHDSTLSGGLTGSGKKIAKVVEYLADSPNAPASAITKATGAADAVVSNTRKLVRRAAGKKAHFGQLPSVKSRGAPRQLYKALELLGDDPQPSPADIAAEAGIEPTQVQSLKRLIDQAKSDMQ